MEIEFQRKTYQKQYDEKHFKYLGVNLTKDVLDLTLEN